MEGDGQGSVKTEICKGGHLAKKEIHLAWGCARKNFYRPSTHVNGIAQRSSVPVLYYKSQITACIGKFISYCKLKN